MANLVPRTALAGQSQSGSDRLAKNLGYFSIALGIAEIVAPKMICRAIGLPRRDGLLRAYGAREIATGVAILASHNPEPWIWTRVAGDAVDLATAASGLKRDRTRSNNFMALAALAAVTALDVVCASALNSEKGNSKTAIADYSERTGFPAGLKSAWGAARNPRSA